MPMIASSKGSFEGGVGSFATGNAMDSAAYKSLVANWHGLERSCSDALESPLL